MRLEQFEMVRVLRLLRLPDEYDGWRVNKRPPNVGDVGIIVDVLRAPGLSDRYVVESSGTDGVTIWLGDFCEGEIEPVEPDAA